MYVGSLAFVYMISLTNFTLLFLSEVMTHSIDVGANIIDMD